MVTRAVHLELVEDMTTECFISCFRRFISRRGKPDLMVSDNAGQFVLTSKVLRAEWKPSDGNPALLTYLADQTN